MMPRQKRMYVKVEKEFTYSNDLEKATKWATVKFVWLARIAGGFTPEKQFLSDTKIKELIDLLTGELRDQKVVVWFRFNAELEAVQNALKKIGIHAQSITGEASPEERRTSSQIFKQSSNYNVMLCQVKCGKFGLDWSTASTAIYFSNSYDMEDRAQSEDRIVHPTKTEPLLYIDLIARNTIDEDVTETLRQKYSNSRVFMTSLIKTWLNRRKRK